MKLKDLYKILGVRRKALDVDVTDLTRDSREIKEGSVFVALKGTKVNGLDFAKKAQDSGAVAIVCENDNEPTDTQLEGVTIPILPLPKNLTLGQFCSRFYDNPSSKLGLIGITGTNGKSTITQLIAQWISVSVGSKCAVLGTLGYGFLPNLHKSANTTLDAVSLQKTLNEL